MRRTKLSNDEIARAQQDLPGWSVMGDSLTRMRIFADFTEAMRFVNGAAVVAEEMGHHPDMDIRYNKVKLALTTHDAGGLTELDVKLAARLDAI